MDMECLAALAGTLLASYVIGSIPSGYLIGRMNGLDIRNHGSRNIGATNVTRVLGKKWGRACFACDFLKGLLPVLIVQLLSLRGDLPDPVKILPAAAAFGTVAGHVWTVFLRFKGGKGVATAAGAILAINPIAVLVAALAWTAFFFGTRYASVASLAAAFALPSAAFALSFASVWKSSASELGLMIIIAMLTVLRHTANIKRLIDGTESRFTKNKADAHAEDGNGKV